MNATERYQAFCKICSRVFEADTAELAVKAVEQHELLPHHKVRPIRKRNVRLPKGTHKGLPE